MPGLPGITDGCLTKSNRAGELFPQAMQACTTAGLCGRFDDLAGEGFWLITQGGAPTTTPANVRHIDLTRDIADESGRLDEWFEATGAEAVVVRPDRYIFGTGKPDDLIAALAAALRG
jgi:3-(3-hydroxy-phenyl)propionate hydroxylase